ncbi:Transcriptional coactivator, partial [Mortierella sp. AD094]
LGPKKRLTVRSWRKQTLIDIREFYCDQNGDSKPAKKGISLTKDQFQCILDNIDEIRKAIVESEP